MNQFRTIILLCCIMLCAATNIAFAQSGKHVSANESNPDADIRNGLQTGMKRQGDVQLPAKSASPLKSPSKGRTAYGYIQYPTAEKGYVQFDVENIAAKTLVKADMPALYGGEYFNGKLFAYETVIDHISAYNVYFYVFDAATGNILNRIERTELYGRMINDMAYDYSTGTMYAISANTLYTVNMTTGELTVPVAVTNFAAGTTLLTLAVDLAGNIYTINSGSSARLYRIDKTTGAATQIGFTGKNVSLAQSMNFDHHDGTLYWCESEPTADNFLKVNVANGQTTVIQANTYEITCFHIPYTHGVPEQPAAVSELTATPGAQGALSAVLNWTNPGQTFGGEALTELTAVKVYVNDETAPVHTVANPVAGETESYTAMVSSAGSYSYRVVAENSAGGSAVTVYTWIGHDVPEAPANVTLAADDATAALSWTAPTAGLHGGYYTDAGVVYDVYRLPGNTKVSDGQQELTFTETIIEPSTVSYRVVARNASGEGGAAVSNTQSICVTITAFPWKFGFEGNATNLPACWEQTYVVNTADWTVVTATAGTPPTVHEGNYKAVFKHTTYGTKTMLATPRIDLSEVSDPRLKFWHTQAGSTPWSGNEKLSVYYKTSAAGEWTLLATYTDRIAEWTERVFALPNPSADYYIGFEGESTNSTGAVQLDDITIESTPNYPIINGAQTLAIGSAFNNLPWGQTREYIILNKGAQPLTVSGIASASSEITVAGLPLTIQSMEQDTVTVTFNGEGLPTGFYNGTFALASNDPATPEFTVNVTATIVSAPVTPFLNETFSNSGMPTGWSSPSNRFTRYMNNGIDNSPCLRGQLQGYTNTGEIQTCYVQMGSNPKVSFHYKVMNWSSAVWNATPAADGTLTCSISISKDNGATWNELGDIIGEGEHVSSSDFAYVEIDASGYANEMCMIRIHPVATPSENVYVYIDNVKAGTEFVNELAALSLTGSNVPTEGVAENYTVTVKNNGTAVLTDTDYTVKLMQKDAGELVSLQGVAIAQYETKEFVFAWTPDEQGPATLYGEVVLNGDEVPANNTTAELPVTVQSSGFEAVQVGTGNSLLVRAPYNTYYPHSISQTIYYPHELKTNGGAITSLTYQAKYTYDGPNLQDVPIQVWIGETDSESLAGGWVSPSTLTEVLDTILNFQAGTYEVTVQLDEPYQYNGKTLVIYSYRKFTGGYGEPSDGFFGTAHAGTVRTLEYNVVQGEIDPANPPAANNSAAAFPNTTFMMNVQGLGALQGNATDGTEPLDSVKLQITGTQLYVLTDVNGNYRFPHLKPGEYEVEISKHGYLTQTQNATVTAGGWATLNATLSPVPVYTVSGMVSAGSTPEVGLEGVHITLSGYHHYEATTDADGNYAIEGVYAGYTYNVQAKVKGYPVSSSTVEVLDANVTHNIVINEYAYIASNPEAVAEGNNVAVGWEAPSVSTFRYDSGVNNGQTGFNAGGTDYSVMGSVYREGAVLTKMQWYTTSEFPNTHVNVFVFALKSDGTPDKHTIIYEAAGVANTPNQWCEHEFPEPVEVPDGFYIGISPHGGSGYLSLGVDAPNEEYPFLNGTHYFNINYHGQYSVEFRTFESGYINQTPMIRAEGMSMGKAAESKRFNAVAKFASRTETSPEAAGELPLLIPAAAPVQTEPIAASKALPVPVGYSVYRLVQNAPESSWSMLGEVAGDVTSYTDTEWSTLPANPYQYAIKVKYAGNNISNPVLTNMVAKGMEVTVTVNITTNSGDPANGAIVTLTSQDNPSHTYTLTANSSTVILQNVWKGETYTVSIVLDGFNPYTETVTVSESVTIDTELTETIATPFGLQVEPTGNPAEWTFSWNTWATQKIAYWNPDYEEIFTIYQDANMAYGVIYDLTDYPDAILENIDFHHASWGTTGTWDYKIHVMDMNANAIIYSSEQKQTTGDDKWEEGLDLNRIEGLGGKQVGIFMEPLGNSNIDAYPSLSADQISANAHSYRLDIATMTASLIQASQGNFGEYLMNLYIYTAEGKRIKVSNGAKSFDGYEVYLDGNKVATTQDVQYLFTELAEGTHQAGVKAVYTTGSSELVLSDEFTVEIPEYTINLSANPTEGGNVTGGGAYAHGEQATVTATPDEHYTFVNWTEDGIEVENAEAEYTFTVTGNRTLVANFALQQFEVTCNAPEHGTLTVTAGSETVANGSMVNYNTVLTIIATPDEGYKPKSLTVNGVAFASGGTHTVVGNVAIEANFALEQFEVTFNVTDEDGEPVEGATIVFNGETLAGYIAGGVTAGEYNYTVSKEGYTTATGTVEVTDQNVTEEVTLGTVGIDDNTLANITVYGNEGNVYIVNKNSVNLKLVQILDALGRVVYSGQAGGSVTIPVNGANGIYVVKLISDDNKVLSAKVILND